MWIVVEMSGVSRRLEVEAFTEEAVAAALARWADARPVLGTETFWVGCNATSGTGAVLSGPAQRPVAYFRIVPPEGSMCGGQRRNGPFVQECMAPATENRRTYRWGVAPQEPAVIWIDHGLCRHCAAEWDADDEEPTPET